MKKTTFFSTLLFFVVPLLVSAQTSGTLQPIKNVVTGIGQIVALLIPIVIGIAIVVFFWGLVKYIWGSGKGHAQGRSIMIAGLVAIFIMVSLFGIISFAGNSIGISGNTGGGLVPPSVNGI